MMEDEKVELICIGDRSGLDTEEIVLSILGPDIYTKRSFIGRFCPTNKLRF